MICDFGDVVVVPFPFVDLPISKRRPALVFSNESFNADNDHSVLAMITTGIGSTWPSDLPISDKASAGLLHDSVVRWKLFTLPNSIILKQLGRLGERDRSAAKRMSRRILG